MIGAGSSSPHNVGEALMLADWFHHLPRTLVSGLSLSLLAACAPLGHTGFFNAVEPSSPTVHGAMREADEADFYTARAVSKYRAKDFVGSLDDTSFAIQLAPRVPLAYMTRATVKLQL